MQFKKFKNEELVEKIVKKQELADTEKKLLVQCKIIRIHLICNMIH